jgi:hypothetical protein
MVKDTDCENHHSVKDFWRNSNIKNTIDFTEEAWAEVLQPCMNERKILPDMANYFCGFEPE